VRSLLDRPTAGTDSSLVWFVRCAMWVGSCLSQHPHSAVGRERRIHLRCLGRVAYLATSIPALLLFQEFYGPGWRLSSKWLLWIYAIALLGLFFLTVTYEHRRTILSPGFALVILVPLELFIDRLAGYRPPSIKGRLVIFTGLVVFFLTFAYDRFSTLRIIGVHATAEPFGFLFLMACLGYVVSKRVAANEAGGFH
jgi:sigma-B regulation protein RsbU (phosphoserine phosphatase)